MFLFIGLHACMFAGFTMLYTCIQLHPCIYHQAMAMHIIFCTPITITVDDMCSLWLLRINLAVFRQSS